MEEMINVILNYEKKQSNFSKKIFFNTIDKLKAKPKSISKWYNDILTKQKRVEERQILDNLALRNYTRKINLSKIPIFNLQDKGIYKNAIELLLEILQTNEPENKKWILDVNKINTILLLAWFVNDKATFDAICKKNKLKNLKFEKNFYIIGERGSGKSSTIYALNELIQHFSNRNDIAKTRMFKFIEQNKISNTFRIEGNINKYTYNETIGEFQSNPINIILDDLKITDTTQSYGTKFQEILLQFLYDRYSIWQFGNANTIITSLVPPDELEGHFPADLYDRFIKQFNILVFKDNQRIK